MHALYNLPQYHLINMDVLTENVGKPECSEMTVKIL